MKTFLITLALICPTVSAAYAGWDEKIEVHKAFIKKDAAELIENQYRSFKEGTLPKIAVPEVTAIPVEESGEPTININALKHNRIQMLPAPESPFASPDCNSGFPEASDVRCELYRKLDVMINHIDQLSESFGFEPRQVNILVFEGLRSVKTQEKLFTDKVAEIQALHPDITAEECESEASKWVSPVKNNIPAHSTGGAIDIRLWDAKNNDFLDMGKFGVIWGPNPHAPTFSSDISEEQIHNRLFLLMAASSAGLVNYPYEFWHFSTGDRYAAYWLKQEKTLYGSFQIN